MRSAIVRSFAVAIVGLIAATATADAHGAQSSPNVPSNLTLRQLPLTILAGRIHAIVDRDNLDGYAGDEFDISNLQLLLYWHGSVPSQITEIFTNLPLPVTVGVRSAMFSLKQLDAEERRLMFSDVATVGADIVSVAPSRDYSGLDVEVAAPLNAALPQVVSTFPTHVTRGEHGRPLGRQSDSSPYSGGAVIRYQDIFGTHTCSTGFEATTGGGTRVMLTDQHCGTNQTWSNGDFSNIVGVSNGGASGIDAMFLSGQSYAWGIYTGDANSNFGVATSSALRPSVGQHICYGGGLSGEVCDNVVMSVNEWRNGIGPGFHTSQQNQLGAAGNGDSGGPAYGYDGMGGGGVVAFGLIDAGIPGFETTCPGYGGRTCYWAIFATNIGSVLSSLGLSIVQLHYHLTNVFSSRCLDADLNTINQNGTKVQLWDCTGSAWQSWYFPGDGTIRNSYSHRCLDADTNGGGANGTKLQLWDCTGYGNQAWVMLGDGSIRNWLYGRCVDADTNTIYQNGTKMQLWDCTGANWQRWYWT